MNESMASHNSWRAGGAARRYYRPADSEDLCAFIADLPADEPILWLGLGSNLLVRDGGWPGTVIATTGRVGGIEWCDETTVHVGAGVPCNKLARALGKAGLVGGEFLAGIPGTVGGALAMNAGAWGGETWTHVLEVETVDREGRRHRHPRSAFDVGYRHVSGPRDVGFLAATFRFESGDTVVATERMKQLLARRAATQPVGQPSCGSVFRNPEGDHSARLIESAGLKGYAVGGARVSEKHANFIINEGGASAADLEAVLNHVRERVEQVHGVRLHPEVQIVGESP